MKNSSEIHYFLNNKTKKMTKKIFVIIPLLCAVFFGFAQKKDWHEMHAFHSVMSKTFHPAEENKLQPTRDNATELLKRARTWQASAVPAGYKAEVAKPLLTKLVTVCEELQKAVEAKKSDEELKKAITKAHDVFHELTEKCKE